MAAHMCRSRALGEMLDMAPDLVIWRSGVRVQWRCQYCALW